MPQRSAAKKNIRKTKRRTRRNSAAKRKLKESLKKAASADAYARAIALLDKAAKRNLLHRNKANRLKSRLHKKMAAAQKK